MGVSAGSFRYATNPRRPKRAWVVLESEDGQRTIAEVLPTDLELTMEADLDAPGGAWWHGVQPVLQRTTIRLEGELVRTHVYDGDVPEAPLRAVPSAAPPALPRGPRALEP